MSLLESGNTVAIGPDQIRPHQASIESMLTKFPFKNDNVSVPELLRGLDKEEPYIMTDLERRTYITMRQGLQIFHDLAEKLSEKSGLRTMLAREPENAALPTLKDFAYGYAAFAASTYVAKRMAERIAAEGDISTEGDRPDLSMLALHTGNPMSRIEKDLVLPVVDQLSRRDKHEVFATPLELPLYVKEVFERYRDLAAERKGRHQNLEDEHLNGYVFNIMDGFVELSGYEDKAAPVQARVEKVAFAPITAREIVGNQLAKIKMRRYMQRLCLYDPKEQMNPILVRGGLSWTNLFDGLPGTGKSSLFRYAMTLLDEFATSAGLAYQFFSVDQSVKDEFYGKTGKQLLAKLQITGDPNVVSLGIMDDLDLLTTSRDQAQGADNDINNILMQYLDGAFTVRRGNVINYAASNEPTGLDNALRNRMNDRLPIDGPVTAEDFADLTLLKLGKVMESNLLQLRPDYEAFATQDVSNQSSIELAANVAEEFSKYRTASVIEFGRFMAEMKVKQPRITGRSANAILEAVKERTANFDVPDQWFNTHADFLDQQYSRKVEMLGELYQRITPDILFEEAQRYFDSEQRFRSTEEEGHVQRVYDAQSWQTLGQIKYLQEQIAAGDKSKVHLLAALNTLMREDKKSLDAAIARVAAGG